MKKRKDKKPLSDKSKVRILNITEIMLIVLGGLGGFLGFEITHHWENFVQDYTKFALIKQGYKLNLMIAFPLLISLIVVVAVLLKQKREFMKKHITLDLLIAIACLYFIYAIIEIVLLTLCGILIGVMGGEFVITPIRNSVLSRMDLDDELNKEFKKEKVRIKAREDLEKYKKELREQIDL